MADRGLYKALKNRLESPRHKNDHHQKSPFVSCIAAYRRDQRWYKEIMGEFARARREAARVYSSQNIDFSRRLRDHRRFALQSRGAYGIHKISTNSSDQWRQLKILYGGRLNRPL